MNQPNRLLDARALGLSFNGRSVLNEVDLAIDRGEIVTLIGPNGAGKTSLVRIALGLQKPTTGEIWRKKSLKIGYMPQKLHIDPSLPLTVRRFLALAARVDEPQLQEALERAGIAHLIDSPMQQLSGGETQRVLLARAILREPELLVLDEPAQGVDITGQAELYRLIEQLRDQLNCGVLMVSHDLHLVMARTDTVICINQHVCCHGHPESVSNHPAYLELFGRHKAEEIAIYTHHHDHDHNIHGDVISCDQPNHQHCDH